MIQPLAMMIELFNAFVANGAVFSFVVNDIDIAQVTIAVLYDMTELASVELWHNHISTHVEKVRITRVNNNSNNMTDNVDEIQTTDYAIHERLNGSV